ncbi:hypothetical protein D1AOALGA4SA_8724 [Olavius algarvensis Delta 1 endosymbiont]|nr:hypothetical protein D1AOALGA4SA_8724 [Olavius algarvensis Delta 1 endosymbiont]
MSFFPTSKFRFPTSTFRLQHSNNSRFRPLSSELSDFCHLLDAGYRMPDTRC